MVAKGSSFVNLMAHVLCNSSVEGQGPSAVRERKEGVLAQVGVSRSTGQVSTIKVLADVIPPPLPSRLSFCPHMYEKDKGGRQVVCTHYIEVFRHETSSSPIDSLLKSMADDEASSSLLACSNRTVHLQLKKRVLKRIRESGTALVLAVGVIGVDKCIQALAVANKELLDQDGKSRLLVKVEKISVNLKYEDGSGLEDARRSSTRGSRGRESREGLRTGFLALVSIVPNK